MRRFVGIDLGCEPVPDETTVCRFRHLLERGIRPTQPTHEIPASLSDGELSLLFTTSVQVRRVISPPAKRRYQPKIS
jgi:IS5 family transposase